MLFGKRRETRSYNYQFVLDSIVAASIENDSFGGIRALRHSDVYTAIQVISNGLATYPIELKQNNIADNQSDLYYLLNIKPNRNMTAFQFKKIMAVQMLLTGNSFAQIKRANGIPVELQYLPYGQMSITTDGVNINYTFNPESGGSINLKPDDVLHFRYNVTSDGLIGISPLHSLVNELKSQESTRKLITSFYKGALNPSGILKVHGGQLDKKAKDNIRDAFESSNTGDNAGRTLVMDDTMDYTQLTVDNSILQYIASTNNINTASVAKAFNIPLSMFQIDEAHTSNTQAESTFLKYTLQPLFSNWINELNVKLLDYQDIRMGKTFTFNVDSLLKLDPQQLSETIIKQLQAGIISFRQAQEKLGYIPSIGDPNIDKRIVSLNYTYAESLGDNVKGGDTNG
ncbi:phage portal protein [Bacillus sp. FSL W8-0223]|uniref:phage portal protein n=1 Tax=Bacillus sp. FSL W8-0223 TaxID=2954595 RepID=UPI0030FB6760